MVFEYVMECIWETVIYARDYWTIVLSNLSIEQMANILIYTAGILWGIELIPQLQKTYKSKNVKGISLIFFATCLVAYGLYVLGNVLLANWNIVIAHIPSLIFNLWMTILIIIYRGNDEKTNSKIK